MKVLILCGDCGGRLNESVEMTLEEIRKNWSMMVIGSALNAGKCSNAQCRSTFSDWAAHTAPLKRWGETLIEGLCPEPIILKGFYSQTYRPEHHNMLENFLFEPRLEPGISDTVLNQLEAINVRLIHLIFDKDADSEKSLIRTYSLE